MLEKPSIPDSLILSSLAEHFALPTARLDFLPLGADLNTAAYRVESRAGQVYFLKLRSGPRAEVVAELPFYLQSIGVPHLVAPLPARSGQLWADIDSYRLFLYPFLVGKDGYELPLTDEQWRCFGRALRAIHSVDLPAALRARIPREQYLPRWREKTLACLELAGSQSFADPSAARLVQFMRANRAEIVRVVETSARLAQALRANPPPEVLCHADMHPGNLLLGPQGDLTIVDWDGPCFAPKERDLMFAGQPGSPQAALFFAGYGPANLHPQALAYFHYERIVEDMAVIAEQLLLSSAGGEDRPQAYGYFISNFEPGGTIAKADSAARLSWNP